MSRAAWTSETSIKWRWMDSSQFVSWNSTCMYKHCNLLVCICSLTLVKVPHTFQQHLSAEKTPTLCDALPSFSALILWWCLLQEKMPEMKVVISAGLKKLEEYFKKVMDVPAYIFSMSESVCPILYQSLIQNYISVLNPNMKLWWYEQNDPTKIESVKNLFIHEVFPDPAILYFAHDW